jgi:hypothetical protein
MREIAYPAALGSCALLARAGVVDAAEWSVTPFYSTSVDYDANRRLVIDGGDSEAVFATADLSFKRTVEDLVLTFEPRYTWRRYSDTKLGNGDDRSASVGLNWSPERSLLSATASYVDQTTLVSELLETGFVTADTHRRQAQAGVSWLFNQTERQATVSQVNYSDTSYYGQGASVLSGYKYTSGSVGERFLFSERGAFTLSAYGSELQSRTAGNSSHEYGVQGEVTYAFSEVMNADVSLGKSQRLLSGDSSRGTTASVALNRSLFSGRGRVSAGYTRSLVPYGFGFLVDQQKYTFSLVRPVTAYVDATLDFVRVQNNETAVLLRLDRPNYNDLGAGFIWHLREHWTLTCHLDGVRTQQIGVPDRNFNSWRTSATLAWSPLPRSRSW